MHTVTATWCAPVHQSKRMPKHEDIIVVTGAAGFIGSCLVAHLNARGLGKILTVDDFGRIEKIRNLGDKQVHGLKHRDDFLNWIDRYGESVSIVYHLGARTDTTEKDKEIFDRLNVSYSQRVWNACVKYKIPLVYASSAATYGLGEHGYIDDHDIVPQLTPLNAYGESKNDFDHWVLRQANPPMPWHGLKFFNVFGPNEYHKGRMASVVYHTFHQIAQTNGMRLFRSHREDIADGEQSRDFIYIKDLLQIIDFMVEDKPTSGLYNCGTGTARSFFDLAHAVFEAMGRKVDISYIDTPADIRQTYQYFTQADLTKLIRAGYHGSFTSLEDAVGEYVKDYLAEDGYM